LENHPIKFRTKRGAAPPQVMARNVLGISWLHGQFQASTITGAAWSSPVPVTGAQEFSAALSTAVRETQFKGQRVVVVIDHRNLLFHVQETPPARGKMLTKILARLVGQNQFFEEPAAYGHIQLPVSKGHHRFLLALVPQSLRQAIDDACTIHGIILDALLPSAAVLAPRLQALEAPSDDVVILATELGDSMNLLLGRADGKLLFSRTVVLGTAGRTDRAAQEINRTLHYAQQQFGVMVNQLFITGAETYAALKDTPIRAGLTITESKGGQNLAQLASNATPRSPLNFVRRKANHGVPRVLAAAGLAAALVLSAITTYQVETQVRAREQLAIAAEQHLRSGEETQAAEKLLQREVRHLNAFMQLVGRSNDAPVAALFTRYLPSIIPSAIRLTELQVSEAPDGWTFQLKGTIREDTSVQADLLENLERDLQASLFKIKVTDSTHQQQFRGDDENSPASRSPGRMLEQPFFITGVIP